ncbi:MAG: alpha/beta hydrolase [Cyclobacteriaceae bacterium]
MTELKYNDIGKGKAVVLVHGFCETKEIWKVMANSLSKNYRVICPDLPGFGESPLPNKHFDLKEIATMLEIGLSKLEVSSPMVIGHSLGGYICLEMAANMGSGLAGLGLFHSSAFADEEEKKAVRNKTIEFVEKNGVEPFIRSFIPPLFAENNRLPCSDKIERLIMSGLKVKKSSLIAYTQAMRDREDNLETLKNFKGRKLLICGEKDPAVPLDVSRKHKEAVNVFHEIADCGHMGMFEKKDQALNALLSFLKSTHE